MNTVKKREADPQDVDDLASLTSSLVDAVLIISKQDLA